MWRNNKKQLDEGSSCEIGLCARVMSDDQTGIRVNCNQWQHQTNRHANDPTH